MRRYDGPPRQRLARWLRQAANRLSFGPSGPPPPDGFVPAALEPVSRVFGLDRGTPIDRYYIDQFLTERRSVVRGHVLEIGDAVCANRYGSDRVSTIDVLHVEPGHTGVTIVGDLSTGEGVPVGRFDCVICLQTLQFIKHMAAAVQTLHASLAPGGTLLLSASGISQISQYDRDRWGEYWRLTTEGMRALLVERFPTHAIEVRAYGNLPAAVAMLSGRVAEELSSQLLSAVDSDYEVMVVAEARVPS